MIAGHKYHGPVADTWSIGVVLFALVCGHLPFEDPNTSNLYRKILSGEYRTPKWISPEVKDLIRKILETDPSRRLTISEVRQHPWCMMVPLSAIPRDDILSAEGAEDTRNEVMKRLTEMNLEHQAVLDAVSSHACNTLSAIYYLLMQKETARYRHTKMTTCTSRPETSHPPEAGGRSDVPELVPIDTGDVSIPGHVGDGELGPQQRQTIRLPPTVAPSHNPIAPTVLDTGHAPTKPTIPKLNIGKAIQKGVPRGGHVVSQSARPEGMHSLHGSSPLGAPELMSQTARPAHVSQVSSQPVQPRHTPAEHKPDPSPGLVAPVMTTAPDVTSATGKRVPSAPLRGLTSAGPHSDSPSFRPDPGHIEDLNVIANGLNTSALPSVEAERPVTRRSKSRAGRPCTGATPNDYDGPGIGKIPSSEQVRIDGNGVSGSPRVEVTLAPNQPHAPKGPQRSGGSASGRRGRRVTGTGGLAGSALGTKPTSRGTHRSGRRNPYASHVQTQNEGISGRTIQPLQPRKGDGNTLDVPDVSAPSPAKPAPSKPYARELAVKNKQLAPQDDFHENHPAGQNVVV